MGEIQYFEVSYVKNYIMFVCFNNVEKRDKVVQGGIVYLDKKYVVVKFWFFDFKLIKGKMIFVFVGVKLFGLVIKYWSVFSLCKIGSFFRKLLMVDLNIQNKMGINFVRILVEMKISKFLKEMVCFKNERGSVGD